MMGVDRDRFKEEASQTKRLSLIGENLKEIAAAITMANPEVMIATMEEGIHDLTIWTVAHRITAVDSTSTTAVGGVPINLATFGLTGGMEIKMANVASTLGRHGHMVGATKRKDDLFSRECLVNTTDDTRMPEGGLARISRDLLHRTMNMPTTEDMTQAMVENSNGTKGTWLVKDPHPFSQVVQQVIDMHLDRLVAQQSLHQLFMARRQ